jgi:hypothetical protein
MDVNDLSHINNGLIRDAFLAEQSEWLKESDDSETLTLRTIARVVADAFGRAAEKYKTKEDAYNGGFGRGSKAWDDEHAITGSLPTEGIGG